MRNKCDLWGIWDSYEFNYHYCSAFIEFKQKLRPEIIKFIGKRIINCKIFKDYVEKIETKLIKYIKNLGFTTNCILSVDDSLVKNKKYDIKGRWHYPYNLFFILYNKDIFAIKYKYNISYLNKNISPTLNYLTRFLLYGYEGIISKGEKNEIYPYSKNLNKKYNLKNDYYINKSIILKKTHKIAIILSYSIDNIQKKHIKTICFILKDFFDKILIVSNIQYPNYHKNVYNLTYSSNIGFDLGIIIKTISYLNYNLVEYPDQIMHLNDGLMPIGEFEKFINWTNNYKEGVFGLTENKINNWWITHLMGTLRLYKGKCVKYFFKYINEINYFTLYPDLLFNDESLYKILIKKQNTMSKFRPDIDKIFCKNDKKIFLTNGLNENISIIYEGYYYIYVIALWELEIYNYFKDKGFIQLTYTMIFDNEPKGIPMLENEEWYLERLPFIKYKRIKNTDKLNDKYLKIEKLLINKTN